MSKVKIFVQPEEEFAVNVFVCASDDGALFCDTSLEGLQKIVQDKENMDVEEIHLTFKKPSFGDAIELHKSIFSLSGESEGQIDFNPIAIRFKKFKTLIKTWDIKDEEGNVIPISDKTIKSLSPTIASVIGLRIDLETGGLLS